jgi:hypothetical protein
MAHWVVCQFSERLIPKLFIESGSLKNEGVEPNTHASAINGGLLTQIEPVSSDQ